MTLKLFIISKSKRSCLGREDSESLNEWNTRIQKPMKNIRLRLYQIVEECRGGDEV